MMRKIIGTTLLALPVIFSAPGGAAAAELANHEAVYRLTLMTVESTGAVVQAHGAMGIRFRRKCNSWQTQQEFLFTMEMDNGDRKKIHRMIRFEENMRGQSTEFTGWTDTNKTGKINYRGSVKMPLSEEESAEVTLLKPRKRKSRLAKGVVLPTQAFVKIMDELLAGETPAPVHYYDPHSKYTELRLLGGAPIILKKAPEGATHLVQGKTWRLRVTPVFDSEHRKARDEHTIVQVHASGVISHMTINLGKGKAGSTVINADLVKVRETSSLGCAPKPEEKKRTDTFVVVIEDEEEAGAEGEAGSEGEPTAEGEPANDLLGEPTEGLTEASVTGEEPAEQPAEAPVTEGVEETSTEPAQPLGPDEENRRS